MNKQTEAPWPPEDEILHPDAKERMDEMEIKLKARGIL